MGSSSELASPGSHQPLYQPPPREAIPASTEAFQLQKDVLYLIQLLENINKPPVLNIPHPHGPFQACASSSSTQMPSLHSHFAWLQGCSSLWTPVHLKTKGSEHCASLPAAPYPLWGSCGMSWFLHPSHACFSSAAQLSHPGACAPITGTGRHHLIAGAEGSMWGLERAKSGLFP